MLELEILLSNLRCYQKSLFYRLPFTNIEKIMIGRGGVHFWTAADFRNRFFGGCLFFKKNAFFTKKVLISPAHYEDFLKILQDHGVNIERH